MIARILFVVCAVVSFALDRLSKLLVEQSLAIGERADLIGDFLQLRPARNSGIAFGLFSDAGSLVLIGTLVVGALLFYFMLQVDPRELLTVAGGGLITGGAIGNLVDRVQHGYVTDFIHVPRWPTFNVADVAITGGVILVLVAQALQLRREQRAARDTAGDPEQGPGGQGVP